MLELKYGKKANRNIYSNQATTFFMPRQCTHSLLDNTEETELSDDEYTLSDGSVSSPKKGETQKPDSPDSPSRAVTPNSPTRAESPSNAQRQAKKQPSFKTAMTMKVSSRNLICNMTATTIIR